MRLPEALFALLRGELVECFGLLFAQKGLVVVLEAFIVVVGLSGYLGVLVEHSVFLDRRLALHRRHGAEEHGAHEAEDVHH